MSESSFHSTIESSPKGWTQFDIEKGKPHYWWKTFPLPEDEPLEAFIWPTHDGKFWAQVRSNDEALNLGDRILGGLKPAQEWCNLAYCLWRVTQDVPEEMLLTPARGTRADYDAGLVKSVAVGALEDYRSQKGF